MTIKALSRLRQLQEVLIDLGFGGTLLSLPAPKTSTFLALAAPRNSTRCYGEIVEDSDIIDVSRDLFASEHYSIAVQEAFKAVDRYVANKVGETSVSGVKLMREVFGRSARLSWSDRKTQSQKDQQEGYEHMFAGAMLGIRNPLAHDFKWVEDSAEALELIVFAQHLMRKAKAAYLGS